MCIFGGGGGQQQADPTLPPETAAMRQPDMGAVKTAAGRRASDSVKSGAKTILTSGSGVTEFAPTEKKTLLGA
jgi:hypothetical protein